MSNKHLLYLTDRQGNLEGVQLSAALWSHCEAAVVKALKAMEPPLEHLNDEPVADFERLLQFWDFRYPYSPEVTCPHCGAHTADWRNDPAHPFHLTTANLGGLLVFRCKSCQSTVRQKHFRDHMVVECTPYNPD